MTKLRDLLWTSPGRGYHIGRQTFVVLQSGLIKLCMQLVDHILPAKRTRARLWGPRTGLVVRK